MRATRLATLLPALLLPLLTGCLSGDAPAPRYTVADPAFDAEGNLIRQDDLAIHVRMAPDLRAANAPTLYLADGTVSTVPGLTYYASLELAIPRALREAKPEDLGLKDGPATIDILIQDFCVDQRPLTDPIARVTIRPKGSDRTVSVSAELPHNATPEQIRAELGKLLFSAIGACHFSPADK